MPADAERALTGRVAIVTGASSGIGAAVARQLAQEGCRVLLVARRADRLEELAGQIGTSAATFVADLTDTATPPRVVDAALQSFGRLDLLVNVAGAALNGPLASARIEDLQQMLELNLLATAGLTQAALAPLQRAGNGIIVNVASVAALVPGAGSAMYAASKAGLRAFAEASRKEVLPLGIRVSTISPGVVEGTELFDHVPDPATRERFRTWLESLAPLSPTDVANAVTYIASRPPHVAVSEIVLRPAAQEI